MVINVSGGNKAKKQKRTIRYEPTDKLTDGQLFGIILDKCGGCHFRLMCSDGRIRNGKLSGRMANGPRINTGSYVIISLRDFEKDQKNCDIIGHASPSADIIRILKSSNNNNKQKDDITFKDSDDEFEDFNNDGGKKEEEDGDENNKEEDGEKGNRKEEEGDITFQDSDEDEEEEKEERASKNKGGIDNDVWEDKEENIKKNIITKDELDDLIDLL
jgi:initiation factor 1A